jgi:hypothetical protein
MNVPKKLGKRKTCKIRKTPHAGPAAKRWLYSITEGWLQPDFVKEMWVRPVTWPAAPLQKVANQGVSCWGHVYQFKTTCTHRLNMELDLPPKFIWASVYSCILIGWDLATPPLPPHLGSYTRALLVSLDRRHLFVTPCLYPIWTERQRRHSFTAGG